MKTKIYSLLIIASLLLTYGCRKDFETLNSDPNQLTTANNGALFNSVIESLMLGWNEQFYINNEVLYKQTQLAALGAEAWGNYSIGTEEIWNDYYKALVNIRELESRFEEMEPSGAVDNMRAAVKTLLAYKTFKLTDLFGDIPYSTAGRGFENLDYLRPAFDSQQSVYEQTLEDLKWVNQNINDTALSSEMISFFNFDNLFNGDIHQWRKFANSLRLKHALRMSEVSPDKAGEIIADILENDLPLIQAYDFITYKGENVSIKPADVGLVNDAYSWSFREHKNLRLGSNIWHQMSAHDSTDGSGIFDVRAYYFFETNFTNQWTPYPQVSNINTPAIGGSPYATHRDNAFTAKGASNIYSPFNYFLIRDSENMSELLLTGAETHFIKAEIYMRGIGVPVDEGQADIEYMQGLEGSVKYWTNAMTNSTLPNNIDADFFSLINVPQNLNFPSLLNKVGLFNFSSVDDKLKMICTQRWIDNFRQPWEAWALARRTMMTPREGDPLNYFKLPYPQSESLFNYDNWSAAVGNMADETKTKVWWMK